MFEPIVNYDDLKEMAKIYNDAGHYSTFLRICSEQYPSWNKRELTIIWQTFDMGFELWFNAHE